MKKKSNSIMSTENTSYGLIATDLELTGGAFPKIVALGVAIGSPQNPTEIETYLFCMDLGRKRGQTWAELWKERDWDWSTYEQFWSSKTDLLDYFEQQSQFLTTDQLAFEFNKLLIKFEKKYPRSYVVVDAPLVEPGILHTLMSKHRLAHLGYHRDGTTYRGSICTDSFQHGLVRADPFDSNWRAFADKQREIIDPLRATVTPYSHNPVDDARSILERTIASLRLLQSKL